MDLTGIKTIETFTDDFFQPAELLQTAGLHERLIQLMASEPDKWWQIEEITAVNSGITTAHFTSCYTRGLLEFNRHAYRLSSGNVPIARLSGGALVLWTTGPLAARALFAELGEWLFNRSACLFREALSHSQKKVFSDRCKLALFLACSDRLLRGENSLLAVETVESIASQTGIEVSRQDVYNYKLHVTAARVALEGRYSVYMTDNSWLPVVERLISNKLTELKKNGEVADHHSWILEKRAHELADKLAAEHFLPRELELHALALLKIAVLDLGLADKSSWARYLGISTANIKRVYTAAYKNRARLGEKKSR